jgi:hypothetical protein
MFWNSSGPEIVKIEDWSQTWWFTSIIPATQEAEVGRSWSCLSLSKLNSRPYLKNKLKAKGLEAWLNGRALGGSIQSCLGPTTYTYPLKILLKKHCSESSLTDYCMLIAFLFAIIFKTFF